MTISHAGRKALKFELFVIKIDILMQNALVTAAEKINLIIDLNDLGCGGQAWCIHLFH